LARSQCHCESETAADNLRAISSWVMQKPTSNQVQQDPQVSYWLAPNKGGIIRERDNCHSW